METVIIFQENEKELIIKALELGAIHTDDSFKSSAMAQIQTKLKILWGIK